MPDSASQSYLFVDRPAMLAEALAEAADRLPPTADLALDTEFMRERTYHPKLCLVQLGIGERILLADPLAHEELAPLRAVLSDARPKLLHAGRQDVEALLPLLHAPLTPVVDTQFAAALLGFAPQIGYGDLVREVLGITLAKGHARTDWTARPLSTEQLAYAADDVRHLPALADELRRRLDALGRLDWLAEECARLSDPQVYAVDPADAWQRVKGIDRFDPGQHAAARALAEWRERRAIARDLPRGWVLHDDAVRALAQQRPRTLEALSALGAPAGLVQRHGEELLAALHDAQVGPEDQRGAADERLTPQQTALLRRLQDVVKKASESLGINAEVLATRRDLDALVRGRRDVRPLSGWRASVAGTALIAACE